MRLKVGDVGLFKAIFRGITRFTDIAHFDIDNKGIRIRSIDPHDFCYVDIQLSPSFFEGYKLDSEKFSSGAEIGKFKHVLPNILKDKPLYLEINNRKISLQLVNGSTTNYELEWLREDSSLPEPMKFKYNANITIPSNVFFDIIKEASAVSREIKFELNKNKLTISATDNDFSYSKEIVLDNNLLTKSKLSKKPVVGWAIVDYLKTLNEIVSLCGEVKLSFGEDLPLRMDLSYRGRGSFTFIIANRKLTTAQMETRRIKKVRNASPILQSPTLPLISVTKFPKFVQFLDSQDGIMADEIKHSNLETLNQDYTKLANLIRFIGKKGNRIYLTKQGKDFVSDLNDNKTKAKRNLNSYLKKNLPEYKKIIKYVSNNPLSADDLVNKFSLSKNKNSMVTKTDDVVLLLGMATWCNAIDRKLGLYYFGK